MTEHVLDALRIPLTRLESPDHVAQRIAQGADARLFGEPAGGAAAVPRPDVGGRVKRLDAHAGHLRRARALRSS